MERFDGGKCPEVEDLSAVFDLRDDEEVVRHVEVCSACGRRWDAYGRIADGIKGGLGSLETREGADRIRTAVGRSLTGEYPESPPSRGFPVLLRVAAVLAVVAVALFALRDGRETGAEVAEIAEVAEVAEVATDSVVADALVEMAELPSPPRFRTSFLDVGSLDSASFGHSRQAFGGGVAPSAAPPVLIPESVSHIWAAPEGADSGSMGKLLVELAGELSLSPSLFSEARDGSVRLEGELTKEQLVRMVGALAGAGFDLISPQAPQPEDNNFVGAADSPVYYRSAFVAD